MSIFWIKGDIGGNIALNIDIRNVFDTMHWGNIRNFSSCFVDHFQAIFKSARLLVLVNGSPAGYLGCSRACIRVICSLHYFFVVLWTF